MSGYSKRLKRFENNNVSNFNSNYSKDELISEIGVAILNNYTGILNNKTLTDLAAYIQGQLNKFQNDKNFIIEIVCKA